MRRDDQLGSKLGPRLVELVSQSVIATRRGLAPHEARVQLAAITQAIDHMGAEHAAFIRPLTDALIARGEMPAELHEAVARAASGHHQWEARALTGLLAGTATSALGTVLSNYLWPVTAELVAAHPNLVPDVNTAAQLVARRWIAKGDGARIAAMQGIDATWFDLIVNGSYSFMSPDQAIQLIRRGAADHEWLSRLLAFLGFHPLELHSLDPLIREWLSPADAALGVLRGNIDREHGAAIARAAGITPADFDLLVANTGEPPGLMQLLEAYRRRIIDKARLERGIRQSRVRDEWIPAIEALRFGPMSTADAADAALRGHLTSDQAEAIAAENGLEPSQWAAYFANQGNPLAVEQLLELMRRGFISEALARKGLRQGRIRDEWIPQALELRYEPISSADAIDAWLRHHIDRKRAEELLAENGLMPRDHEIAFGNAGNPLGLTELMDALRRGIIDRERFAAGFHESRYRDEWLETAYQLRHQPLTTAEAVEASVQGWLTKAQAQRIAEENGLEPSQFDPLWNTYGLPLSRTEAEELYNRGELPLAALEQALRESRLKDRYIGDAVKLHVRLPEARQVLTMVEYGAIGHAEAASLLAKLGYQPPMAAAFLAEAEARATGGHRQVATAEVTGLYESKMIDRGTAEGLLGRLHYTAATASMLLDLAEHKRRQRILETGVASVRNQYVRHRLSDVEATADLAALRVPADAAGLYLLVWQIERRGQVRELTEAQIVKAHHKGLFNTPDDPQGDAEATARLEQLGYSPGDAQLLLEGA